MTTNAPTEYDRRGPNDRAEIEGRAQRAAIATGIPHYVLANSIESWVAGQNAKDNFWANLVPLVSYDRNGERI